MSNKRSNEARVVWSNCHKEHVIADAFVIASSSALQNARCVEYLASIRPSLKFDGSQQGSVQRGGSTERSNAAKGINL